VCTYPRTRGLDHSQLFNHVDERKNHHKDKGEDIRISIHILSWLISAVENLSKELERLSSLVKKRDLSEVFMSAEEGVKRLKSKLQELRIDL